MNRTRVGGRAAIGLAAAVTCALAAPATGQCEQDKLIASDSAAQDRFGIAVGIHGNTAIVGSWLDDTRANDAGSAYIYTLDGTAWSETQKLTADDGALEDQFGVSVAIRGDLAIAGAWLADENGNDAGAAYIFRYDGASWIQEAKLLADDGAPGDQFGNAVAVDEDVAIVASVFDDDGGQSSGAAYVFRHTGGKWAQEQKLTPADFVGGDQVGVAVAVDDDVAVVSAPGTDTQSGVVYVFRRTGSVWAEEQKLQADDRRTGDFFGNDVDVAGDAIVIGAVFDDGPGGIDSGSIYVFRHDGIDWTQEQKLTADDAAPGDRFGSEVAIDGTSIVAGAPQHDLLGDGSGAAYVFRADGLGVGASWAQAKKITASDGKATDEFGGAVAVHADMAIIGAALDEHGADDAPATGSAYVFVGVRGSDCNENGVSDACDIADGTSRDDEGDGIPDECQCPEDLDDDDVVGFGDLLEVLTLWGPCEDPDDCPEDFSGDGVIGFAEVLQILAIWGPCEE